MGIRFMTLLSLLLLAAPPCQAAAPKTPPVNSPSPAKIMFDQVGEEQDAARKKAVFEQLRALADQGDSEAVGLTAALLYPQDLRAAYSYTLKSLDQPARLPRQILMIQGLQCERGFNEKLAADTANQHAADASPAKQAAARIVLGLLAEYGGGDIVMSKTRALEQFRQAADLGNPFGLTLQGRIYEFDGGKEVPVDQARALELYKSAADRNDPHGIWMYATLKKELGDDREWESLVRKSATLGNEGAMVDLGEWLVRMGDDKSRQEGNHWLSLAMRLNNPYAFKVFALLVEEGKIPVEHPAAVAWTRYRDVSFYPCGANYGPEGMARVLPGLKSEPASVIRTLSKNGITGLAMDMLARNAANGKVRQAAREWAISQENTDSGKHRLALLIEATYAAMQYDERAAMADAEAYAASLYAPLEALLIKTVTYLNDLSSIDMEIERHLGGNGALSRHYVAATPSHS